VENRAIVIIDYGAGNLRSVANAIAKLGYQPRVVNSPKDVLAARTIILPGVGAAADTMAALKKLKLIEPIKQVIAENRPFFGVCLGLQILFDGTEEGGWHECLGIFRGRVRKLPAGLKIPHMGWNQVKQKIAHPIFKDVPDNANFYFVHSYYADPEDKSLVAGETEYGIPFCSALAHKNMVATQFHPEKSGEHGLQMYRNFIEFANIQSQK
jgi:glutamine amidotransferase